MLTSLDKNLRRVMRFLLPWRSDNVVSIGGNRKVNSWMNSSLGKQVLPPKLQMFRFFYTAFFWILARDLLLSKIASQRAYIIVIALWSNCWVILCYYLRIPYFFVFYYLSTHGTLKLLIFKYENKWKQKIQVSKLSGII